MILHVLHDLKEMRYCKVRTVYLVKPLHSDARWLSFPLRWLSTGATNIIRLPLTFVRSGDLDTNSGKIYGVGSGGFGWSHTAFSSTTGYYLGFDSTAVGPSNNYSRWNGFPFR